MARLGLLRVEQVDDEDQRLIGLDDATRAPGAVAEVRRDRDLAAAAHAHALDALVPAADDVAGAKRERQRRAAVPKGVELLAAAERDPHVVHVHDVAGLRLGAVALDDVGDLELDGRLAAGKVDLGLAVHISHAGEPTARPARRAPARSGDGRLAG